MSNSAVFGAASLLALLAVSAASSDRPAPPDSRDVDFDRDVLPILGAKCLSCHSGPSPKARLDLLSRKNALAGGMSGESAVVPGSPDASRLLAVVDGSDGELRMPPRGAALTSEETKTLRAWIAGDAQWSASAEALIGKPWHWAYRPPLRATPPPASDPAWQKNEIDRFVLATLEREGLRHAPQASRTTLARRLSLAITGLLPEPEDAAVFAGDKEPAAVERYVDRLLASPHYGERMARMWLDFARYADTNGYEKDDRRSIWPWRDWVIDSFNQNMPFDRFTIEQLAGDLLDDATLSTRIATGFHRNTMTNEEGGTDPEEFRVAAVHDRVSTTASVWLGSTLGCAQCHDHKFDPFTIDDYYSFFAFFDGDMADTTVIGPSEQRAGGAKVEVVDRDRAAEFEKHSRARDEALAAIVRSTPEFDLEQASWERERRDEPAQWTVLTPLKMTAESGATLSATEDGCVAVSGAAGAQDRYALEFELPDDEMRALKLEVLPDSASESHGVGRSAGGNFVLSEFEANWVHPTNAGAIALRFANAFADHEQQNGKESWLARHAIDGDAKTGWAVAPLTDSAHELVLESDDVFAGWIGGRLVVQLRQQYGSAHTIARLRLSASSSTKLALLAPLNAGAAAAFVKSAEQRTDTERELLAAHFRSVAPSLAGARAKLAEAKRILATIPVATTLVMQRADVPRTTRVHRKGNFLDPGAEVTAQLPRVFGSLPDELPRDRLGLARWIASAENPLFARVFVNHLWALDFGQGLVASLDDFGTQGEAPSDPELLDALAVRFSDSGFDVKDLQRMIVTSQTFLQDSRMDDDSLERDPHNRWLACGPRFRLEAEALRDISLCASGLLARRIGGASVFPPQPPGIWTMIYSSDQWTESTGPDRYRRGLYTFARRTAPYPTTALFDAPSREISCPRRSRTNTPLQALASLNDPQFVECAVALARRMLREADGTEAGTLERGFRLCLSREPDDEETKTLLALYREQWAVYSKDTTKTATLLANGPAAAPADLSPAAVAAWTVVANVLLNLDEALSQE